MNQRRERREVDLAVGGVWKELGEAADLVRVAPLVAVLQTCGTSLSSELSKREVPTQ